MKRLVIAAFFVFSAAVFAQDAFDDLEQSKWLNWNTKESKVQYKRIPGAGLDNSNALGVVLLPDNPENGSGVFLRNFPVEAGSHYRVKVSAKALKDSPVNAGISMQVIDAKGKVIRVIGGVSGPVENEWKEFSMLGEIPSAGTQLRVLLSGSNGKDNTVLFDNVYVEKFDAGKRFTESFDYGMDYKNGIKLKHVTSTWDSWASANTPVTFFHTSGDGRGKNGAAGIRLHQVSGKKASGSIIARCGVIPGEEYTLVVYAKSADLSTDATVSVGIQGQDGKNNFLGTGVVGKTISATQCEDEWTRIILMFPVPDKGKWAKCEKVLITMSAASTEPGTVLFDDFMIFNTKSEE